MTFLNSMDQYTGGVRHVKCHVCGKEIRHHHPAVTHDGTFYVDDRTAGYKGDAYGALHLHTECATILILRLAADVMRQKPSSEDLVPHRVVESLAHARKESELR
jgi:hypothetical protein